ncbi:hypothetical protein [Leptothrix discophora]|uniref:Uncharacterized protein n=1 Tax=Leptothrix discophora TaxID=89 RepID=A0ABT9G7D4_LEPDI|nr:hypothetical protein [Leptothrix discophora]MDP4302399.1 hypothetical protein [Leptothrix discophora]
MNVALPALVVFLALLPGFIARSRIKRAERLSLDYSPFGQVATEAMVWAIVLHGLWLGLATTLAAFDALIGADPPAGRPPLDAGVVLHLLAAHGPTQSAALDVVAQHAGCIGVYLATLILFSYAGPTLLRHAVTRWRLDRRGARFSPWLRFSQAPWYYLLSGADFAEDEVPDFIAVSALVDVAGQPWLYKGILDDYDIQPDGQLDRLVLGQVIRRPLSADKGSAGVDERPGWGRFYPVDGDCFVLRYAETITLNIEYIKLARAEDPEPRLPPPVLQPDDSFAPTQPVWG